MCLRHIDRAAEHDVEAQGEEMATHTIGVDLGGTNLRCAVIDDTPKLIARRQEPMQQGASAEQVIDRMADLIREVIDEVGLSPAEITGVGVGAPGPLDSTRGVIIEAPNLGWGNVPFAETLRMKVGIDVVLENDANCAGWGEYRAGAGRGCKSMVLMTLGTGIGGALILNGELLRGADGIAGEIGHMVIVDGGRAAATGNRGVLEAYASATASVERFREALRKGWQSSLSDIPENEICCRQIFEAACEGDSLAAHIVSETGRYLGLMTANLANLLNPERCVFSGGMIAAGDILFNAIREECVRRAFPIAASRLEIMPAELGMDAGLIGAAEVARDVLGRTGRK